MIIAVDTETRGLNATKFVCGCVATEKGTKEFFTPIETYDYIIDLVEREAKRGHKTYVYGHRHEYDFYAYAKDRYREKGWRYLNFNPFIAIWKNKGYFLDSHSLFKMSLKELGLSIGLQKMETPEKLLGGNDEELTTEDLEEIVKYCKRDAEIVLKGVIFLRNKLMNLGYKPRRLITSGQVAMSTFVSHLHREGLWWKLTTEEERGKIINTKFEREVRISFRGGRNEAFQVGTFKKCSGLDINSLYPFIMKEMAFPDLKTETLKRDLKPENLEEMIGFAEAEFIIPKMKFGYLPIRYKNHLLFPKEKGLILKSWWTVEEINDAIKLGYEPRRISKAILFETGENIFKDYITSLYKERQRSDRAMKLVIKIIMNSLFGKFGQRGEKKVIRFILRRDINKFKEWEVDGCLGESYAISKVINNERRYFVNPVIPALITAYARKYLFEHIKRIKEDDLIYVDTDSVIVKNLKKYNHFEIGKGIGQWKEVFKNKTIDIKGEKRYYDGENIKVSGVARRNLVKDDYDKGILRNQRMNTIKTCMKGKKVPGTFEDIEVRLSDGCKNDIEFEDKIIVDNG